MHEDIPLSRIAAQNDNVTETYKKTDDALKINFLRKIALYNVIMFCL